MVSAKTMVMIEKVSDGRTVVRNTNDFKGYSAPACNYFSPVFLCASSSCVRAALEPIPPRPDVCVNLISVSKGQIPVQFSEDYVDGIFSGHAKGNKTFIHLMDHPDCFLLKTEIQNYLHKNRIRFREANIMLCSQGTD